ncbi:MAG TPA: M48 family metallopeptidase [Blastocatellia bacterium]|nr:M48 family metallopeptidase [Blastocatellia bacterium]
MKEKENPQSIGKRDINKGQINFYSLEKEVELGSRMAAQVDNQQKLVTDPIIIELVNRVTQNLVINSDVKMLVTVKIINSSELSAFSLPGGYIYVNRGMLDAVDDEAELAAVLAHEIAHVAARHGAEQASRATLISWLTLPLSFLGSFGGSIDRTVGLAVPKSFLKFSRGSEREADQLAVQYLWKTGYDPRAMITFFEKVKSQEKNAPGTLKKIFRSHSMNEKRLKDMQELMARFPEKTEYQINSADFIALKDRPSIKRYKWDVAESKNDRDRRGLKRKKRVRDKLQLPFPLPTDRSEPAKQARNRPAELIQEKE